MTHISTIHRMRISLILILTMVVFNLVPDASAQKTDIEKQAVASAAKVDALYQRIRVLLKGSFQTEFDNNQKCWLAYRDSMASVRSGALTAGRGTTGEFFSFLDDLNSERLKSLEQLYELYQGSGVIP